MTHQQAYDNHCNIIKNYVQILYTFLNNHVASNIHEVIHVGDKLITTLPLTSLLQLSNEITTYYNTLMYQHLSLLHENYNDIQMEKAVNDVTIEARNVNAIAESSDAAAVLEKENEIGYTTRRAASVSRPAATAEIDNFTTTSANEYLNFFSSNIQLLKPFATCFLQCLINIQPVHEITINSITKIYQLIETLQDNILFKMFRIYIESPSNTNIDEKYSVDLADRDNLEFIIRNVQNNIQYVDTKSTPYESAKSVYDRSMSDRFNILLAILRTVHDDCKSFLELLPESVRTSITSAYNNLKTKHLVYIPVDRKSDLGRMPAIRNFFTEYNKLVSEHVRMMPIVASGTKRKNKNNDDYDNDNDDYDDSDAATNVRRRRVDGDFTLSRRKLKNIKPLPTSKFLKRTLEEYSNDGAGANLTMPPLLRAINEIVSATYKSVFNCVPNEMLSTLNYSTFNKNTVGSMNLSRFDHNINFYRLLLPLTYYGAEENVKSRCVWFIAKSHLYFINNAKDFDDIRQSISEEEPNRDQIAVFMIKYQFLWFYNKFVQNQLTNATVNKFQNPSLFQVVQLYNSLVMNCYASLHIGGATNIGGGNNLDTHERIFKIMSGYF
ncbi:vp80 [Malacosoma neustria nucleopolyhedrovirus]|uniref:vp80 n=1 Tax=Malacosoma neustria nuclear polyhedrosis virus TaxID=38012 RepID=UPI000E35F3B7|nr:vp80 [Malacosoma neustria nucleopolyhedrovirus]AUF81608.1 vp80 [Malacosoma neustria nucleopolyhedrovirus]